MKSLLLLISSLAMLLFQSIPPARVQAVLFWTPGCPVCESVITNDLTPLEAQYGSQLQIQKVPLNNAADVDALMSAASFFGLTKDQVVVPFLVVGNKALSGQDAIEKQFPGIIVDGLAQGGILAPKLPPALAILAGQVTATSRPTLEALGVVPPAPGVTPTSAASSGCVAGSKTGCAVSAFQPTPTVAAPELGAFSDPLIMVLGSAAAILVLGGLAWFFISRRPQQ